MRLGRRPGTAAALTLLLAALLLAAPLPFPTASLAQPVPPTTSSNLRVALAPLSGVPPGQTVVRTVNVTYEWGAAGAPSGPTEVQLEMDVSFRSLAAWADLSLEPTTLSFQPDNQAGSDMQPATLTARVDADAPAYINGHISIQATAPRNGQVRPASDVHNTTIQPAPVLRVNVSAPSSVTLSGGAVAVPVTVGNTGNGPVRVALVNVTAPSGVEASPPAPVLLGRSVTGDVRGLAIEEDLRDAYEQPSLQVLELQLSGSGSGPVRYEVRTGPWDGANLTATAAAGQVEVGAEGGLPVPLLLLAAVGAVAAGGAYAWRRRRGGAGPDGGDGDEGGDGDDPGAAPDEEE